MVAEAAGVVPSLVHRYFGSKSGLVAALVNDFFDRFHAEVLDVDLEAEGDWAHHERLRLERGVRFHYAEPLAAVIYGPLARDPDVARTDAARNAFVVERAARSIRKGQRRGELPVGRRSAYRRRRHVRRDAPGDGRGAEPLAAPRARARDRGALAPGRGRGRNPAREPEAEEVEMTVHFHARRPDRGRHARPPRGEERDRPPDRDRARRRAAPLRRGPRSCSVAVVTGAHGTFCAGNDLKSMREPGAARSPRVAPDGDGPVGPTRMLVGKPTIAAVEGHAVAGGLELALWCDLRVAAEDAVFGVYCRRWSIPLMDGGTVRLPRIVGQSHALDLILTGRGVSGEEAVRMGLVNRLVPKGKALDAALELARQLAALPQAALRSDRLSAYEQWSLDLPDALANEYRARHREPGRRRDPLRPRALRLGRAGAASYSTSFLYAW